MAVYTTASHSWAVGETVTAANMNSQVRDFINGFGAWTSYTPTVTAGAGTFTTVAASGAYMQVGKLVVGYANITITTNGTAATSVLFTLPVTSNGVTAQLGTGRGDGVSGKELQVKLATSTTGVIFNYDNTYPGATGEVLRVQFTYQAV